MMKEMNHEKFTKMCRMLKLLLLILPVFLAAEALICIGDFIADRSQLAAVELPIRLVNLLSLAITSRFGAAAFRSMERSETPFLYDVSDKIKAASFWLVGGGIVCSLYKGIVGLFGIDLFTSELSFTGNLVSGMILFALVYVIERGCRLQKESDETL